MSGELTELLKRRIGLNGPITVADYMTEALGHRIHGYYKRKDPLGVSGDFVTAPEISQMFGEIIGLWVAVCWRSLGEPSTLDLVELGPGRGALMADALRAGKAAPGFSEALRVHLVETSPVLKAKQKEALSKSGIAPNWHETIEGLPCDAPVIVVANEFFDALPIHQYVKTEKGWRERRVHWNDGDAAFRFVVSDAPTFPALEPPTANDGEIFELSPASTAIARTIGERLRAQSGAALIIDYGHGRSAAGETLQALRDHARHEVLSDPGAADLTAHVDFEALGEAFRESGADVAPMLAQGDFLTRLGIRERARRLIRANPEKARDLLSGLDRLIDPEQMGASFKVLVAHAGVRPPGFDIAQREETA